MPPIYIFSDPKDEERTIEIVQSIHDKHEYIDKDGVKWNRIFTVPNSSIGTKIDPFDSKQFIEKTGKSKDNVGALLDRAKELSEKRANKLGVDPIKEKYYKEYSKFRNNKVIHPKLIKENQNKTIEIDIGKQIKKKYKK